MTVSACRFTPKGWSAVASFGRRRRVAPSRYRPHSSPTCSTGSTGVTRFTHPAATCGIASVCASTGRCSVIPCRMDSPPDDIETLKAELALARARAADDAATIARQNLEIAKLRRQLYGPRSERKSRLLDQMEFELEELEAAATEDEIAAERAAAKTTTVAAFTRKRPARQPFPEHLPRERLVIQTDGLFVLRRDTSLEARRGLDRDAGSESAPVECHPARAREVRRAGTARRSAQPPAPFHVSRAAGPGRILAMLLFEKSASTASEPQAERSAREGVP